MTDRSSHIQEITRYLRILFKTIQAHAKHVESTCGLSGAKLWMLFEINANPGLKVSQLAAALTIHPSTCSNMLDKLEQQRLIRRKRTDKDQRAVRLYLTAQGNALLEQAPKPAQGELNGALHSLSDNQLALLDSSLETLVASLTSADARDALQPIPGDDWSSQILPPAGKKSTKRASSRRP